MKTKTICLYFFLLMLALGNSKPVFAEMLHEVSFSPTFKMNDSYASTFHFWKNEILKFKNFLNQRDSKIQTQTTPSNKSWDPFKAARLIMTSA